MMLIARWYRASPKDFYALKAHVVNTTNGSSKAI